MKPYCMTRRDFVRLGTGADIASHLANHSQFHRNAANWDASTKTIKV